MLRRKIVNLSLDGLFLSWKPSGDWFIVIIDIDLRGAQIWFVTDEAVAITVKGRFKRMRLSHRAKKKSSRDGG
jgi:hypothetical protein